MEFRSGLVCLALLQGLLGNPALAQQADVYTIDSNNSILRVYVGRAGVLARMGHNHVVHTRELSGQVLVADDPMRSSAFFSFPVSSFVVDDAAERERAGDGYDSQPGSRAIEGTRRNMLGEDLLNAEVFPMIAMRVTPVSVLGEDWSFSVAIDMLGSTFSHEIPARVTINDESVSVSASFTLQHEDLGLSPYSAAGGSLRVAGALDFELQISATRQ